MDLEKLWKAVLAEIELSVSRVAFHTQFKGSSLVSLANNVASVGFPNAPIRTLVESRYYSLIKSILDHHTNENISLVFVVAGKRERLTETDAGPLFSSLNTPLSTTPIRPSFPPMLSESLHSLLRFPG